MSNFQEKLNVIKDIESSIKYHESQIAWYLGEGGKMLNQKRALARPSKDELYRDYDVSPEQIIQDCERVLEKLAGDLLAAKFRLNQKTYLVFYQRTDLIHQSGTEIVEAHSPELALQMVKGAVSVKEHQERGVQNLKDQISQISEWGW